MILILFSINGALTDMLWALIWLQAAQLLSSLGERGIHDFPTRETQQDSFLSSSFSVSYKNNI